MNTLTDGRKGLTAFHLKLIALVCMIIDHVGASTLNDLEPLRWIGRIAFPIYAFLIAEGCRHTRNRTRYLLRLGIFALISEMPFDLAFSASIFPSNIPMPLFDYLNFTNIFYTLFFSVACIQIYETLKRQTRRTQVFAVLFCALFVLGILVTVLFCDADGKTIILLLLAFVLGFLLACERLPKNEAEPTTPDWLSQILSLLPCLPILFLTECINCDYDMSGVLLILLLYFAKGRKMTLATLTAGLAFIYGGKLLNHISMNHSLMYITDVVMLCFSLLSLVLVYLYNGERGRPVKWLFYWAYPAHIAVLAALRCALLT